MLPPNRLSAQTDPRGDYRTWHTEHFRIHARVEHGSIALAAAREAERAYQALSAELRPPRGTTDLVLYDNVDFANGFTSVFPTNRIAIYLTPPAGEIGLARYDDWLRLALTHELAHVFHLDRADGIWRVFRWVFGRAPQLFPNAYRPAWVTEGLATYYETRLTAGGRGRGGFHRQLLVASALERRWPAPGDANFGSPKWPAGATPYAWGSRFFLGEAVAHGDSVIPRFVNITSRRLWPLTISGPLKQAGAFGLGTGWKEFRRRWENLAGVQPEPVAGSGEPSEPPSSPLPAAVIARGLRAEPHPQLSPDGRHLAYMVVDGRHRDRVAVRDLAAGQEIASHRVTSGSEPVWVGEELLVAELELASPVEIRSHLSRWTPGGSWRRASRLARLTSPFAAPGGIGAIQLGPNRTSVVRLVGDSAAEALSVPAAGEWSRLSLSPDGRQFAGARHADGRWDIVVWRADAPHEGRPITDDAALDDHPSWSPAGDAVVFMSERSGLPQIYAYSVATGELTQLTAEATGARAPTLSADGTLYYSTILADGYAVLSRRLERAAPTAVEPVPDGALVDPPQVAARESRYRPWTSLAPRYWLPLVHDAGATGRFFGGLTNGYDVLGRLGYAAGATFAPDRSRWEAFVSLGYTRWSAVALDLAAEQFWDVDAFVRGGVLFPLAERDRALTGGATLRWRRWRSEVSGRWGGEITQEAFFAADSLRVTFTNPTYAGAVASFRASHANRPALSISPEDGIGVSGLYRRRWQIAGLANPTTGLTGWSDEWRGSVRAYLGLPLPGFARWALAARLSGAVSGGPNARTFALGGESGGAWAILPGLTLGSGSRDFPLRGYPRAGSRFTRVVVGAAELRVPLFLIGKGIWKLPLGVDRISVTGFGEIGGGWRRDSGSRNITQFRDVGAELVADLALNGDSPLRLRLGAARALADGLGATVGSSRAYVAIGSSF
ncbi:MAG: PD40 domain-containing protein [Gemmatimonadetes bacterium]|nr:PD40 domain-containing protein [Gemmatimonadota bacterium]